MYTIKARAAGRRRNADRLLRLLRSRGDRLSGPVEGHRRRDAATSGTTSSRTGTRRSRRRTRARRAAATTPSSATTRTGMRRACARITSATSRSICRSAKRCEWKTTAYGHKNAGRACGARRMSPTPGGAPLSVRSTEYYLKRIGVVTVADAGSGGAHEVKGGVWYETNDFTQARRFYGEPSITGPTRDFAELQSNAFRTDWEYDFDTESVVFHLQDTWSITDKLRLNFGFRSVHAENNAKTVAAGPAREERHDRSRRAVPAAGRLQLVDLRRHGVVRIRRTQRSRVREQRHVGPVQHDGGRLRSDPRRAGAGDADNFETGLRFRGAAFEALVAVYHVDFKDRLRRHQHRPGHPRQSVGARERRQRDDQRCRSCAHLAAAARRSRGSRRWPGTIRSTTTTTRRSTRRTRVVQVKGKQVTDTPEILLKSELTYDNGAFFASANVNYTDERFYTYLNQGSVDAYTLVNLRRRLSLPRLRRRSRSCRSSWTRPT